MYIRQSPLCAATAHIRGRYMQLKRKKKTMYNNSTVYSFLLEYKLPIIQHLLKDKSINLSVYLDNNKLKTKSLVKQETSRITSPKRINKEELESFFSYKSSPNKNSRTDRFKKYQEVISKNYIITEEDIEFAKNEEYTGFNHFSISKGVLWSDELIERYLNDWDWKILSRNPSIFWSKERILKFQNEIDFKSLSFNKNIVLDNEILKKFESNWDWNALCGNPSATNQIEYEIINHPKAEWTATPDRYYHLGVYESKLYRLNDLYDNDMYNPYRIKPSICTNPSIKWTLQKTEKYFDKIDFWLLALFGNIDYEVIYEYRKQFDENRIFNVKHTKYSDWRDEHPIYRNGWENLILNESLNIDMKLFKFLREIEMNVIRHEGDASTGHTPYNTVKRLGAIMTGKRFGMSFKEFVENNIYFQGGLLLNKTHIDKDIYLNIISPAFKNHKNLIKEVFELL